MTLALKNGNPFILVPINNDGLSIYAREIGHKLPAASVAAAYEPAKTYTARAKAINTKHNDSIVENAAGLSRALLIAGSIAIAMIGLAVGYNLPVDRAGSYDLVQMSGDESDIVDYNLTFSDCLSMISANQAAGVAVTCERAR